MRIVLITQFCGLWQCLGPVNRYNHNYLLSVITTTDRPKSVRNRCVIEVLGAVFVLSLDFHFLMLQGILS